jgi:ubiquinone/menaquinone biosynthesis C-methylase UbiE
VPTEAERDLEERLAAAIEPWLGHMRWRKDYDAWRERRIWQERYQSANVKDIRRALDGRVAGKAVLDLGAGMGGLSVAILLEFGGQGLRLQAMDYNRDYCRIARLRALRYDLNLPVVVAAGEELPYPDNGFDLIACLDVLEHVADVPSVLREMRRVLRTGGIVLTSVPNRRAFRDPHYHLALINWLPRPLSEWVITKAGRTKSGGPLQDRQEHSELNTYTWGEFKQLAAAHGLRARDLVYSRIAAGEIRQLHGVRKWVLTMLRRLGMLEPIYRLYRYGWQGTYQIALVRASAGKRETQSAKRELTHHASRFTFHVSRFASHT